MLGDFGLFSLLFLADGILDGNGRTREGDGIGARIIIDSVRNEEGEYRLPNPWF